jgi:hypothetical protein
LITVVTTGAKRLRTMTTRKPLDNFARRTFCSGSPPVGAKAGAGVGAGVRAQPKIVAAAAGASHFQKPPCLHLRLPFIISIA